MSTSDSLELLQEDVLSASVDWRGNKTNLVMGSNKSLNVFLFTCDQGVLD